MWDLYIGLFQLMKIHPCGGVLFITPSRTLTTDQVSPWDTKINTDLPPRINFKGINSALRQINSCPFPPPPPPPPRHHYFVQKPSMDRLITIENTPLTKSQLNPPSDAIIDPPQGCILFIGIAHLHLIYNFCIVDAL